MNQLLMKCPNCGVIYRITHTDRDNLQVVTDFGDHIQLNPDNLNAICLKCNDEINLAKDSMVTKNWIADALFRVKG